MIIAFVALWVILAVALYYGPGFALRALAKHARVFLFTPANTISAIVTHQGTDTDDKKSDQTSNSGPVVNALHGVPGETLDKSDPNPMNWKFVPGQADPDHDKLVFRIYGIQPMGNIWWKPRINVDRRLRFGRDKDDGDLKNVTKVQKTAHVYYTGELTVEVKGADTKDQLGINFEIDFAFKRTYPIRSILKLADSAAFLTSLVENVVNNFTSNHSAVDIYGGPEASALRKKLVEEIAHNSDFADPILEELGLDITSVSLRDVDLTDEHKRLLEADTKAKKETAAEMIRVRNAAAQTLVTARAAKQREIMENDAAADRLKRVIKPAAASPQMVEVFRADRESTAIEKNTTITTWVKGATPQVNVGG